MMSLLGVGATHFVATAPLAYGAGSALALPRFFVFAGLLNSDGQMLLVTTNASSELSEIHARMLLVDSVQGGFEGL